MVVLSCAKGCLCYAQARLSVLCSCETEKKSLKLISRGGVLHPLPKRRERVGEMGHRWLV